MIKIPKKQSYNFHSFLAFLKKSPSLKIIMHISLFLLFAIAPFYYLLKIRAERSALFIFYLLFLLVAYLTIKKQNKNKSSLMLNIQDLQENINTETAQINTETGILRALEFKINRYNSLKYIIQEINASFDLASIVENLVDTAFNQIAHGKGSCLLYLVDVPNQKLNLYASKKEDCGLVIKAKEGDIFDSWVLRHTSTLFIEDIKKDFRFDVDKINEEHRRHISSLISSPLVSEQKTLGIIRLDSPDVQFFTQEDSRFLNTISDLGAVALENFYLFEATQELAIKDDLTSLYRKGYLLERLKEEFKRSLQQKRELSLLMVDIDHFKDYNDKFGHTAGDIVLRKISDALIDYFKEENFLLSRFGGEEFCILLPGTKKKNALKMAQQFRQIIEDQEIILRRQKTNVTVSVGVATYPDDVSSEEELLHKSDLLLYQAKNKGRNRVCSI